jgi:hypothetical protein
MRAINECFKKNTQPGKYYENVLEKLEDHKI